MIHEDCDSVWNFWSGNKIRMEFDLVSKSYNRDDQAGPLYLRLRVVLRWSYSYSVFQQILHHIMIHTLIRSAFTIFTYARLFSVHSFWTPLPIRQINSFRSIQVTWQLYNYFCFRASTWGNKHCFCIHLTTHSLFAIRFKCGGWACFNGPHVFTNHIDMHDSTNPSLSTSFMIMVRFEPGRHGTDPPISILRYWFVWLYDQAN